MIGYLIGHRGASGYEPENTLLSFRRAFEDGANAIELDLRLTEDGEIVVIHDGTVDRTTNGSGRVDQMDLGALLALDAGKGERIPTVEETLILSMKNKGTLFVEIKVPGLEEELLSVIHIHDVRDRVVVFGLPASVKIMHELDPSLLCTSPGRMRIGIGDASEDQIFKMHARGLTLVDGDLDDEKEMGRLIDMGVDGINL